MQQKEVKKHEVLKRQGHDEYRETTEGDFLGEVTCGDKVICHFYHREFYRYKKGIVVDWLVCFEDLGSKDDFSTRVLENILKRKGIIVEKKKDNEEEDDETDMSNNRRVRSSTVYDSDLDSKDELI
ncbi:hypothetical protein VPH35_077811 [Triticum aestivum]|uniref:Uncharacterized protein n=1 Tax=Aegilops tauschii TaxID=37682 RepID=M8CC85_AEGTA